MFKALLLLLINSMFCEHPLLKNTQKDLYSKTHVKWGERKVLLVVSNWRKNLLACFWGIIYLSIWWPKESKNCSILSLSISFCLLVPRKTKHKNPSEISSLTCCFIMKFDNTLKVLSRCYNLGWQTGASVLKYAFLRCTSLQWQSSGA